jgi:hypothetical protein
MRRAATLLTLALTVGAAALAPPALAQGGGEDTVWLCFPGVEPNPCRESLETTVYSPTGESTVENPGFSERPKVDCFYVYPTVSEDPGANSDLEADQEEVAIARYQAARFSHRCRVYAPMYRQRTLGSIAAGSQESQAEALRIAYGDVRAAFQDYLANHNRGRGFVLIGHSQGTTMLRQLVREQIDRDRKLREQLVSALLLGADVIVREGRPAGGDFGKVPACTQPRQTGCVVAYSTYNETPPPNSRFARPDPPSPNPFDFPSGPGYEVLCNNPAALAGGVAPLQTLVRSEPYPGVIGALLVLMYGGPPPSAPTPWLRPQDHYTGECREEDGADFLYLAPIGDARTLNPSPDRSWGLHLADVNIALGDLVELVRVQKRAYVRAQRRG